MRQGRGCAATLTAFTVVLGLLVITATKPERLATVALVAAVLATPWIILGLRAHRRQLLRDHRLARGLCFECGYDLRGSVGPEKPSAPDDPAQVLGQHRCPECGEAFDPFRI